jgi:hypothetical protein
MSCDNRSMLDDILRYWESLLLVFCNFESS